MKLATWNVNSIRAREERLMRWLGANQPDVLCLQELKVTEVSAYVPNGATVGSDKWAYKLEWLRRLRAWLDRRFRPSDALAVCGDFNVAPEPRDVCDPVAWECSAARIDRDERKGKQPSDHAPVVVEL